MVHVTQGSIRPDMTELVAPTIRALADDDVVVVATTGGPSADEVAAAVGGPLPGNARVVPFVPYDLLAAHADVFVTNGGYTGVTIALHHGVPIVQAGRTEEKGEIGARIHWSGVGVRLGPPARTMRPSAPRCGGSWPSPASAPPQGGSPPRWRGTTRRPKPPTCSSGWPSGKRPCTACSRRDRSRERPVPLESSGGQPTRVMRSCGPGSTPSGSAVR